MIATIGLPGSNTFNWTRVKNDQEAREWRAAWLEEFGTTQQTLNAVRQGLLITEKDALRARWQNGSRIYAVNTGLGYEIVCQNWRAELAEIKAARDKETEVILKDVS